MDALFGALADATRRRLLMALVQSGPASATRLAEHEAFTRQAIVKHLQAMEEAGLVRSERVGREVRFVATTDRLSAALAWLFDTGAQWDRRTQRLQVAATRDRPLRASRAAER